MSAGDRDTLAALLAEHTGFRWDVSKLLDDQIVCTCGEVLDYTAAQALQPNRVHRAHVADVLLASGWLTDREADAWDEGRDVGHEDTYLNLIEGRGDFDAAETPNPYRRTTEDH